MSIKKMYLFDQNSAKNSLQDFFSTNGSLLASFGKTVNQTFEAHVFAICIKWYKANGWNITIQNPKNGSYKGKFQLKFNTRGAPRHYTYAICAKDQQVIQIRHGLRVSTRYESIVKKNPANICLDISIIKDNDLTDYDTSDSLPNDQLVSFGEAKHMSAFAELIANFIGMVHELMPEYLTKKKTKKNHLNPFLYVSGYLNPTAKGIKETIENRNIQIEIYSFENKMV